MKASGKKGISFKIKVEPNSQVYVAGTFNDWNAAKNQIKEQNGIYATNLFLPRGKHEYKFIVNDAWTLDQNCGNWATDGMDR